MFFYKTHKRHLTTCIWILVLVIFFSVSFLNCSLKNIFVCTCTYILVNFGNSRKGMNYYTLCHAWRNFTWNRRFFQSARVGIYYSYPIGRVIIKLSPQRKLKFFPARRSRKGKNFFFLRGDNFIVTRPIG